MIDAGIKVTPNNIKALRIARKLTQAALAKKVDLSPSAVSRHENGNRRIDQSEKLRYTSILGNIDA
jgi:transcriptional regulator with XRE-family HTH domain